jgi:competence protein ComEA
MIQRLAWLIVWWAGAGLWIAVALRAAAGSEPAVVIPGPGTHVVEARDCALVVDSALPAAAKAAQPVAVKRVRAKQSAADTGHGCVNINQASARDLECLPGIGPVLAERIIAYREAHGSFSASQGLMEVKGIGEARLSKIEDRICF